MASGRSLSGAARDLAGTPHGATPTGAMTHIAIAETLDGGSTTWLEHVADEQYHQGPHFQGGRGR